MRSVARGLALGILLAGTPVAAEDAGEHSLAIAPPSATGAAAGNPAAYSLRSHAAAIGSDIAAAPPAVRELAPVPPPPPPITLVLNADLRAQRLTVIENGKTKYSWPISSGRRGFATPTGTFRPQWAARMWYSRQYELAPMPHAIFFHRGTAFHATSAVGLLGQPASHGCVRLAPGNAATLFKLVHRHGYASTKVVVHGGSKRRDDAVARRGTRADTASLRERRDSPYRVSRTNARRSSFLAD
jgi:hypothetical protein